MSSNAWKTTSGRPKRTSVDSIFTVRGFSFAGTGQNMALGFVKLKDWSVRTDEASGDRRASAPRHGPAHDEPRVHEREHLPSSRFRPCLNWASPTASTSSSRTSPVRGYAKLMEVRNAFLAEAAKDPRLTMVRHNGMDDTAQMNLNIDRQKLSALGLSIANVNSTISTALGGTYVNDFMDRGRIKQVWVQGQMDSRMQPKDLERWHVKNATGEMVPLSSFMTTSWSYGSPDSERFNGLAAVNIQGSPAAGVSSGEAMAAVEEIAARLPARLRHQLERRFHQEREAGNNAAPLYGISLLVVFLCLAALYESWSIPAAVILVVPCGRGRLGPHVRARHEQRRLLPGGSPDHRRPLSRRTRF